MNRFITLLLSLLLMVAPIGVPTIHAQKSSQKTSQQKSTKRSSSKKSSGSSSKKGTTTKKSSSTSTKKSTSTTKKGTSQSKGSSSQQSVKQQQKATSQAIRETNRQIELNTKETTRQLNTLNLLSAEIAEADQSIHSLNASVDSLNRSIAAINDTISQLDQRVKAMKGKYAVAVKRFQGQNRTMSPLAFIFSSDSFAQAYRRSRYLKQFSRWRERKTAEIRDAQGVLQSKRESLASLQQQRKSTLRDISTARATLQNKRTETDQIVESLRKEKGSLQAVLRQKEKESRDLDAQLQRLIAEEQARRERELAEQRRREEAARQARIAEEKRQAELAEQRRRAEEQRRLEEEAAALAAKQEAEARAAKIAAEKKEKELAAAREAAAKQAEAEKREAARREAERKEKELAEAKREAERKEKEAAEAKKKARKEAAKREAERKAQEKKEKELASKREAERKATEKREKELASKAQTPSKPSRPAPSAADLDLQAKAEVKLSGDFESNRGRLPYPVTGKYSIVKHFGRQRHPELKYVETDNSGIDIQVTPGTKARAIFPGTVSAIFRQPGYNNIVMVRHGSYLTIYAGLGNIAVKTGDQLAANQAIGTVYADPDDSNRSILHFEIRREKVKLNPEEWLR